MGFKKNAVNDLVHAISNLTISFRHFLNARNASPPNMAQGWPSGLYILCRLSYCACYDIISYGQLVFFQWQIGQQHPVRVLCNHFSNMWILGAFCVCVCVCVCVCGYFFCLFFMGGGGGGYFLIFQSVSHSCIDRPCSLLRYSSSAKPIKGWYNCVTWSHIAPYFNLIARYITGIPWWHITIFWTSYLHICIYIQ